MHFFHTVREVFKSHLVDQYIDGLFALFGFTVPLDNFYFHSYEDVTITDLCSTLILPLSNEGFLACMHTYCDTGHLYIMAISEDP